MPHVETKEMMVRSSPAAITRWVGRLRSDVHGGTATEYAVLLASFVLGSVLLIAVLGRTIATTHSGVTTHISKAVPGGTTAPYILYTRTNP